MRGGLGQAVRLLAATKYVTSGRHGRAAGGRRPLVGENRADELEEKWRVYGDAFEFHFIGHLQRRKVRQVHPVRRADPLGGIARRWCERSRRGRRRRWTCSWRST